MRIFDQYGIIVVTKVSKQFLLSIKLHCYGRLTSKQLVIAIEHVNRRRKNVFKTISNRNLICKQQAENEKRRWYKHKMIIKSGKMIFLTFAFNFALICIFIFIYKKYIENSNCMVIHMVHYLSFKLFRS